MVRAVNHNFDEKNVTEEDVGGRVGLYVDGRGADTWGRGRGSGEGGYGGGKGLYKAVPRHSSHAWSRTKLVRRDDM